MSKICLQFCKNADVNKIFKLTCAGETCCHPNTRNDEHLRKDKKSNIYKHLDNNENVSEVLIHTVFLF